MIARLIDLIEARRVGPLDQHLALALGRLANERSEAVLVAVALASRQISDGHVCLDLPLLVEQPVHDDEGRELPSLQWPALTDWLEALSSSELVQTEAAPPAPDQTREARPLVLDRSRRLYLRRYFDLERRLATCLVGRSSAAPEPVDAGLLAGSIERSFGPAGALDAAVASQVEAVRAAIANRFAVISGGPGTGKTSTAIRILVAAIEQHRAIRRVDPRVALVAPTGKAAARLAQTIQREKTKLASTSAAVLGVIPDVASTIHRLLKPKGRSSTRFLHDARHQLDLDVVVVDEASMIDLALMTRLMEAIPESARVVLLGDKDQLVSVEAGAILGAICDAALEVSRSPGRPSAPAVVCLEHNFRYGAGSGIGALARAINQGDATGTLDVLESARFPEVRLLVPESDSATDRAIAELVVDGYRQYLLLTRPLDPDRADSQPAASMERLRAFERFRLLCAHRRGAHGVDRLNRLAERALESAGLLRLDGPFYPGRPVMITENNYDISLFNGDIGFVIHERSRAVCEFVEADGHRREISLFRLPPHETVYGMTVHKSQGSEFEEVVVVLPDAASPLLTRELLYTAVTRARRKVTLVGSPASVRQAVGRRIQRSSGLKDALLEL
ncbi:MAG: exodeoxyribonuclease V subunit alpha [Candidatus Riflebacteria bacterium]|nr:exodeoxyribonuclease V subunit alpha [Candidatus Riflebacteria bacterium]